MINDLPRRDPHPLWFAPGRLREEGETPDCRFSLANERTFLARLRTALALLVAGVLCALRAVNHWVRCERAMRGAAMTCPRPASRLCSGCWWRWSRSPWW